jgi:Flp pilus assembly protein TadD
MTAAELFVLGRAQAQRGEVGKAISSLEQAVEMDPGHAEACKLLARLSLRINEVRAFTNWCHEALRIAPHDAEPHRMMAEFLAAKGRHEEAEEARRAAEAKASSRAGKREAGAPE